MSTVPDPADLRALVRAAVADALEEALPRVIRDASLPTFMTKTEAADFLGFSPRKVDRLRDSGDLPYTRRGRRVMFRTEDLRRYLNEGYVPAYAGARG